MNSILRKSNFTNAISRADCLELAFLASLTSVFLTDPQLYFGFGVISQAIISQSPQVQNLYHKLMHRKISDVGEEQF